MMGSTNRSSSWLNWAQAPREQGGLGLAPHQAAGVVGNLVNESGQDLSPWGPTGDNGTAWGTAQWRGDRLARLKQRPDYQTMEGQQAFMREELDGSENKAYRALQAAKSPEEAAHAWDALYERSDGSTRSQRMASARALMDQFGGGTGSPGALTSSFAPTQESKPTMAALSADNAMGPGALGAYTQERDPLNVIGQGLTGIGASLAGITNPDQAKVLAAQAAGMQKAAVDRGTWSVQTMPNGQAFLLNGKTKQMTPIGNYAKPEKDAGEEETKKLEAKASMDKYTATQDVVGKADEGLANIAKMRTLVQNPNVVFGGGGDAAAWAKNLAYSLGIDVKGLTDTQAIQRMATEMQLSRGKLLPGAISNYEDKLMGLANGVGIDKSREANLAALDAQEAILKHQKMLSVEAQKYKAEHGKLDDGWDAYRAKFAPAEAPAVAAPAAQAPAASKSFKTKSGINWSY